MNEHKLITPKQFGFRLKLSSGIVPTHFTDCILGNMDSGNITGDVFWISLRLSTPLIMPYYCKNLKRSGSILILS